MSRAMLKETAANHVDPLFVEGYVGWASIPGKGRGVVALKHIPKGTVVERCLVLVMPWDDKDDGSDSEDIMNEYFLRWGPEIAPHRTAHIVAGLSGHLMLYNHAGHPNVKLRQDHVNTLMEVIALHDIAEGDELTFNYDCELWFDYKE